jgi:LPS sulfotransferase NodH
MIVGNVDCFTVDRLSGWIADESDFNRSLMVRVIVNGASFEVFADTYRSDIEENLGPGRGNKGFDIDLTHVLRSGTNTIRLSVLEHPDIFKEHCRTFILPGPLERVRKTVFTFEAANFFGEDLSGKIPIYDEKGSSELYNTVSDTKMVLLLFSNRSGSNLVSQMLETAGFGAGALNEPFLPDVMIAQCKKHNFRSIAEYISHIITDNRRRDICFLKISAPALMYFMTQNLFGPVVKKSIFIICRRNNKLEQAISYWRAIETGNFYSGEVPFFNFDLKYRCSEDSLARKLTEISEIMKYLIHADSMLEYFKNVFEGVFLDVYYEDILSDMSGTYNRVVDFVEDAYGVPSVSETFIPRSLKTSTAANQTLKEAFQRTVKGDMNFPVQGSDLGANNTTIYVPSGVPNRAQSSR